jgi:hypothetical protein
MINLVKFIAKITSFFYHKNTHKTKSWARSSGGERLPCKQEVSGSNPDGSIFLNGISWTLSISISTVFMNVSLWQQRLDMYASLLRSNDLIQKLRFLYIHIDEPYVD